MLYLSIMPRYGPWWISGLNQVLDVCLSSTDFCPLSAHNLIGTRLNPLLHKTISYLAIGLVAMGLWACSQERKGKIPVAWHNLNSKYNAHFLALEKMNEAETMVRENHSDNYNRILDVMPVPSAQTETSLAPMLTECLKKASIPIQRHKNSDWVDDCYLLVGKVRYYKREEYDMAVYTFKYNFSKSKDPAMKQQSIIWLMRTYLKGNDLNGAFIADDYLMRQAMYKDNLKEYYVTKAWFHQKKMEYKEVAYYLEKAVKLMLFPTDEKARYYYIIAQIRQRLGEDKSAFENYSNAIGCFPPYEMDFYAKANIGQVTSLANQDDINKINKYFKKLLKDEKNKEFKDKVYYEMGRFEARQGNTEKAIENWNLAVRNAGATPYVKSYAYLRMGETYYEKLKQFNQAKFYYDSALLTLDTLEENYASIKKRGKYLTEFIKAWEVVDREDSLQRIARMDSNSRNAIIDKMIAKADDKKKKEDKLAKQLAREAKIAQEEGSGANSVFDNKNNLGMGAGNKPASNGTWYFYNPASISAGRDAFVRKWGNRVLEDNWRRSKKEKQVAENEPTGSTPGADTSAKKQLATAEKSEVASKEDSKADTKKKAPASAAEKRASYLADLPLTEEKMLASNAKIEPALFDLGKVYDYRLEEYKNAEITFERLVRSYPNFEKRAEAMYYLYTLQSKLNSPSRQQHWKDQLLKDHPESIYAKLLLNPNYLKEQKASNAVVADLYKQAYEQYESERFAEATTTLNSILKTYPDNDLRDKIALLQALLTGRTVDYDTYKQQLVAFQKDYPKSKMVPFARDMIKQGDEFLAKMNARDTGKAKLDSALIAKGKTPYSTSVDGPQIYVVVIKLGKMSETEVKQKFANYNRLYYPEDNFNVEDLLLGDEKHFVVRVREFATKFQGLNYMRKQQDPGSAFDELGNIDAKMFVITPDNFRLFYKSKNILEYYQFFQTNYDMSEL